VTNVVTDIIPNKPLSLKPISIENANAFVREHHRHNKEVYFGPKFAIAVVAGTIWGVAIVSHPVTRALNQNGYTGEVRRVCTRPGAPVNCCSMLYSACWRAWRAMGGLRMITYTLTSEQGSSLKSASWKRIAKSTRGKYLGSWETHPQNPAVTPDILKVAKWRWEVSV
jgi:hypothetical protein